MSDRSAFPIQPSGNQIGTDGPAPRPPHLKALFSAFACLAVAMLVGGALQIAHGRRLLLDRERQRLEAVAELKTSLLSAWLAEREGDAVIMARDLASGPPRLSAEGRVPAQSAAVVDRLGLACRIYGYDSAEILDLDGRVVLGFPPRATPGAVALDPRELAPAAGRRVRVSFAEPSSADRNFRLATALPTTDGEPARGYLVLTANPERFLDPLLSRWPGQSASAETLLVRRDGDFVTFLGGTRHLANNKGEQRAPVSAAERVSVQGALGHTGALEGVDFRHHRVLAATRQIPGMPWNLVVKIDRDEVLAEFDSSARATMLGLGSIFALSFALGLSVYFSQRRSMLTSLERANRRFLALFDHADEGVVLFGRDGLALAVNAKGREIFRVGDRPVAGLAVTQFFAEDEQRNNPVRWRELEEKGSISRERRFRRADGEIIVAQAQTISLPDGRYVSIVQDLTEWRAAEQRERRAKRIAKLGAWEWDARTGKTHWDDETYLLFGYDPARDLASSEAWMARIHPGDRERVETILQRALADEAVYDFEHRILLPDGSERWVRCLGDIERDESGAPLRIEGAIQDLTDQRRASGALEAARQQLAESQKTEAIGRLAGGIAHDFNNVVGIILGYCELAEMELPGEHQARPHLAEIGRAAGRAGELTRQLLAFARRQPVERRVVAFASLLAEARKLLAPILGEHIELEISSPADVGSLLADPAQITHLILNLAVNARDAMPRGGRLVLTARAVDIDAQAAAARPPLVAGPAVELTVVDTGVGMDAQTLQSCFEPFFTTKGPGVGTGLGLSSVKRALESCGGAIEVESEPGHGTCFRLWFPALAGSSEENDRTVDSPAQGRGERILVVDDVAQMREVAKSALARAGFRVTTAESGEGALAQLEDREQTFDLLLTDVIMPGLDGRQLARRALEVRPGLPVLFMSGYADLPRTDLTPELALECFIEKPFTGTALARKVRAALDRRAKKETARK